MIRTIQYVSPTARHVVILRNPTAGADAGQHRVDELRRRLETQGLGTMLVSDRDQLAETLAEPGCPPLRAVVAAGGDGTVSAVANRTDPATPLTILPLGTENLLARYLEYPLSLAELSHVIVHGATIALDVGDADGQLFLLMASCGFDAEVVRRLHRQRRGNIRHSTYIKPILDTIRTYQYPTIRVHFPPATELAGAAAAPDPDVSTARWVFAVNLPKYAGGLSLAPDAVGNDGHLDVCLFRRGSLLRGLGYLAAVVQGRHRGLRDVVYKRVRGLRLEADGDVPYQLDGDPGGVLPVTITARPGRVRLLVSETWAVQHGFQHDGACARVMSAGGANPIDR